MSKVILKSVYKIYDDTVNAVQNFNLEVKDNEFIVLLGPSGCGKSTVLRMIAGLEEISSGKLYIDDKLCNDLDPKDRDIAMVFQNYALYPHMTIYDNMAFGLKLRKLSKDEIDDRVYKTAEILGISNLLDKNPKSLSIIQRQLVALGRAVVRNPKVFLLDDPLANLDSNLKSQMRAEIIRLHKNLNTTFIYVSHDQDEATQMGNRIVVMKDGIIKQVDTPQNLYENPCNDFVAGFIGTPSMNFIDATIIKENNKYSLSFADYKVSLPQGKNKDNVLESYIDKEIILGIRPEALQVNESADLKQSLDKFKAEVESTELTADNDTYLYLSVGKNSIISKVKSNTKVKSGNIIDIYIDTTKIHIFDKDTGKAILN